LKYISLFVALLFVGCASNPKTVTGTVTYKEHNPASEVCYPIQGPEACKPLQEMFWLVVDKKHKIPVGKFEYEYYQIGEQYP
jgi:hypothetical protein